MSITIVVKNAQGTSTNFSSSNFTNLQRLMSKRLDSAPMIYFAAPYTFAVEDLPELITKCEALINIETSDDDEEIEIIYRFRQLLLIAQESGSQLTIC